MTSKRFQVALSFPSEHREFVSQVANFLQKELGFQNVFYDEWWQAELARPNLDTYLQSIYHDQSELIVPFLCEDYEQKEWCGLEWRAIRDLIKRRKDSEIMLTRFDYTNIPGLYSIDGYIELPQYSAEEVANLILKRLQDINSVDTPQEKNLSIPPNLLSKDVQELYKFQKVVSEFVNERLKEGSDSLILMDLDKTRCERAVDNPFDQIADRTGKAEERLPAKQRIVDFYNEAHKSFLILGEPGAGKTTLCLELMRDLMTQPATNSLTVPILVNLSSWNQSETSLASWLCKVISEIYGMPKKSCEAWLKDNRLVLLLDGLDEVSHDQRIACVKAINQHMTDYGLEPGLMVCSRLGEYDALVAQNSKLRLHSAMRIETLTTEQVDAYLRAAGLNTLRTAWLNDPILQSLATSPFILDIMSQAYADASTESLTSPQIVTTEVRIKHLFDTYMNRMFEHRPRTKHPYEEKQTVGWLTWLAKKMQEHSQSEFLIERLQPSWLSNKSQLWLYTLFSRLLVMAAWFLPVIFMPSSWLTQDIPDLKLTADQVVHGMLVSWWIAFILVIILDSAQFTLLYKAQQLRPPAPIWKKFAWISLYTVLSTLAVWVFSVGKIEMLMFAPVLGLFMGLQYARRGALSVWRDIYPVEVLSWSGMGALKGSLVAFAYMILTIASIFVVLFYYMGLFAKPELLWSMQFWTDLLKGLAAQPIWGAFALLAIETGIIIGGLRVKALETVTTPNQGIKSCIKNSVRALVISAIFAALFTVAALVYVPSWILLIPSFWLTAIWLAFWFGAQDAIYHGTLRVLLAQSKAAPLKIAHFLDYGVKLGFLKKAGGSYEFIHRTLLEHFAAM
ncbi:MAG: NACHT domain-containing protein [Methylococcaceae bacterium]